MATIYIYDEVLGKTYSLTVDVGQGVMPVSAIPYPPPSTPTIGSSGSEAYYIVVATSAKDPEGHSIKPRIVSDDLIATTLTGPIDAAIVDIMKDIEGEYASSSSSSSSLKLSSSSSSSSSMISSLSVT
jgi:hypothetical protein